MEVRQCSLNKPDQREMGFVQRAPKTQAQNLQQARMFSMKAFEQLCSLLLPSFSALLVVPDHLKGPACMPADTPASLNDCWLPDTPAALSCLPALKQLLAPCLASAADSAGMSKSDWNVLEWLTAPNSVGSAWKQRCCGFRIEVRHCSLNKSDQREMGFVQ